MNNTEKLVVLMLAIVAVLITLVASRYVLADARLIKLEDGTRCAVFKRSITCDWVH